MFPSIIRVTKVTNGVTIVIPRHVVSDAYIQDDSFDVSIEEDELIINSFSSYGYQPIKHLCFYEIHIPKSDMHIKQGYYMVKDTDNLIITSKRLVID